jgi:MHS family citrate/tricarballylate:H+ symporter-like MFS transporter
MAVGTLSIAITPSYASIGLLAPLLVLAGRLIQGLSAGVEMGGVSVYLSEIATPGRKGFYVNWQTASQQVGVISAALLGLFLSVRLSADEMRRWGWRIPLLAGCMIIPLLFVLRRSLEETPAFMARKRRAFREILITVVANWHAHHAELLHDHCLHTDVRNHGTALGLQQKPCCDAVCRCFKLLLDSRDGSFIR